MPKKTLSTLEPELVLFSNIKDLIIRAKESVISHANSALVLLNWNIGKIIKSQILIDQRAEYGKQIVATLSQQLSAEFGRGFTPSALLRMIQFYETFPNEEILATLSRELGWSHFVELIPMDDPIKREFYAELCRVERWSVRTLRNRIDGMLFERTMISKKPELTIKKDLETLRKTETLTRDLGSVDIYFSHK